MEETKNALMENEEVMESVVDEVVKTGSKLTTIGAIGLGVAAGLAISVAAPKAIGFVRGKLNKRRAAKLEKDYIAEEIEMEVTEDSTLENDEK